MNRQFRANSSGSNPLLKVSVILSNLVSYLRHGPRAMLPEHSYDGPRGNQISTLQLCHLHLLGLERKRPSPIEVIVILAIVFTMFTANNLTCHALLDQAAKREAKQQKQLATIALWLGSFCYDQKLIAGICYYRLGQFSKAKQLLDQVVREQPNSSQALDYHGLVSFKLGDYQDVIADYDQVLLLPSEQSARVYALRGVAKNCLGEPAEAVRDLNMALAKSPGKIKYLVSRAQAYTAMGAFSKALKDANKAIKLDAKFGESYLVRGSIYKALGQWQSAFSDAKKAIELDPDSSYAYSLLGEFYMKQAKFSLALEYFNTASKLDHKNWFAENGRKYILARQEQSLPRAEHLKAYSRRSLASSLSKNYDHEPATNTDKNAYEAVAYQTTEKGPAYDAQSLLKLGCAQLEVGQVEQAIQSLSQGVRRDPNDPILRRYLAQAFSKSGQGRLVEQQIKAIYQLHAQIPADLLMLANAQKQLGEFRACIISYGKCLEDQNLRLEGTRGLVDAYVQLNDFEKAKALVLSMIGRADSTQEKSALLSIMQTIPTRVVPLQPDRFPSKDLDG